MKQGVRILRILQILQETRKDNPVNIHELMEILESRFQIKNLKKRTLYRDIDVLKACDYRIKKSLVSQKGWYLEKNMAKDTANGLKLVVSYIPNKKNEKLLYGFADAIEAVQKNADGTYQAVIRKKANPDLILGWFLVNEMIALLEPGSLRQQILDHALMTMITYSE